MNITLLEEIVACFTVTAICYLGYNYVMYGDSDKYSNHDQTYKVDMTPEKKEQLCQDILDLISNEEINATLIDEEDVDEEDVDEEQNSEKQDNFVRFKHLPRLRKGYYRIRFENSDNPCTDYLSISDRDTYEKIKQGATNMMLNN